MRVRGLRHLRCAELICYIQIPLFAVDSGSTWTEKPSVGARREVFLGGVIWTMRMARSIIFGEYLGYFFMTPFSQTMEPLQNLGWFKNLTGPRLRT